MFHQGHWEMFARWRGEMLAHEFYMIRKDGEHGQGIVTKIELTDMGRHGIAPYDISNQPIPGDQVEDFLQAAIDCGWELGLRPKGFKDHTNELTAVRYHLEDMRTLSKLRKRE